MAAAPQRVDAGLIVGTYRYLVASLVLPARWLAYMAGFGGGKEKGLGLIEAAANYPSLSQPDARFALVLLYNREARYAAAQTQLAELRRVYPRNRLLWLESGATYLRAGKPAEAEAVLTEGMRMLAADKRHAHAGRGRPLVLRARDGPRPAPPGAGRDRRPHRGPEARADRRGSGPAPISSWARPPIWLATARAPSPSTPRPSSPATTSGDTEAATQARRYAASPVPRAPDAALDLDPADLLTVGLVSCAGLVGGGIWYASTQFK